MIEMRAGRIFARRRVLEIYTPYVIVLHFPISRRFSIPGFLYSYSDFGAELRQEERTLLIYTRTLFPFFL